MAAYKLDRPCAQVVFFFCWINNINLFFPISDQRRGTMSEHGFQQPERRKGERGVSTIYIVILLPSARAFPLIFFYFSK